MNWFESRRKLLSPVKLSVKKISKSKSWGKLLKKGKNISTALNLTNISSKNSSYSDYVNSFGEPDILKQSLKKSEQRSYQGETEGATLRVQGLEFEYKNQSNFASEETKLKVEQDEKRETSLTYERFEAVLKDRRNAKKPRDIPEFFSDNLESQGNYPDVCSIHKKYKKKGFSQKCMDRSRKIVVENIYDIEKEKSPHVDARKEFITEKFVVSLNESPRRRRPLQTPICKSTNRVKLSESVNNYTIDWERSLQMENRSNDDPAILCGSNNVLNISFSSSFCSDDSLSDLISDDEEVNGKTFSMSDDEDHFQSFDYLRGKRNEQCRTIRELTKVLKLLRKKPKKRHADAILQAERGLLLSTEKCKNFMINMTNPDFEVEPSTEPAGTVVISKIDIPLKQSFENIPNTYYMCIVSSGVTNFATKYTQPKGPEGRKYLSFNDEFVFEKLDEDFKIEVKVYFLELKYNKKKRPNIKKKRNPHPVKLYYNTHVTAPSDNNEFLQPAFKHCGTFEITMQNFSKPIKNYFPDSRFYKTASIKWTVSKITLNSEGNRRGFLHFGQRRTEDEIIVWNMKYVVLEGSELRVYHCPSQIDKEPLLKLDLKNVASEIVAHSCHLKYCWQLDIVYEDSKLRKTVKFPYYLRAITWSDFKNWIEQLNYVINMHKQWHLLPYVK